MAPPGYSTSNEDRVNNPPGLRAETQDRTVTHFFISEIELSMLEKGAGSADRTLGGLAVGIAATCGVADRTVSNLSAYNHAMFVVGFWVFLILALYSAWRASEARSLNRRTAADVRKRQMTEPLDDGEGSPVSLTMRMRCGNWIAGKPKPPT